MNLRDRKNSSRNSLEKKLEEFVSEGRSKFYLFEIVEEANVSVLDAEDFFVPLLRGKKIEGKLEVRCPKCGAALGTYKRYPDVPEEITCELCETEFPRSSNVLEIILEVKGEFFRAQEIRA